MSWIPTTDTERDAMLATIGVGSIDELFDAIPQELRVKSWDLPGPVSEMKARRILADSPPAKRGESRSAANQFAEGERIPRNAERPPPPSFRPEGADKFDPRQRQGDT